MAECSKRPLSVNVGASSSDDAQLFDQNASSGEAADQVTVCSSKRQTRTRLSEYQKQVLKRAFESSPYLTPIQQTEVAVALGITKQVLQNWFKNKRYRLRLKMESTVNKTTCMMPVSMPHYIENTAPQSAYMEVPNSYFYRQCSGAHNGLLQCFNTSQGQEQEMEYWSPPTTNSY
ncbi:hypothetical protein ACROYT_G026710 [Oculina patagonica]